MNKKTLILISACIASTTVFNYNYGIFGSLPANVEEYFSGTKDFIDSGIDKKDIKFLTPSYALMPQTPHSESKYDTEKFEQKINDTIKKNPNLRGKKQPVYILEDGKRHYAPLVYYNTGDKKNDFIDPKKFGWADSTLTQIHYNGFIHILNTFKAFESTASDANSNLNGLEYQVIVPQNPNENVQIYFIIDDFTGDKNFDSALERAISEAYPNIILKKR